MKRLDAAALSMITDHIKPADNPEDAMTTGTDAGVILMRQADQGDEPTPEDKPDGSSEDRDDGFDDDSGPPRPAGETSFSRERSLLTALFTARSAA